MYAGDRYVNTFRPPSTIVDGIHSDDHGFVAMAKGIGEVLEKILNAKAKK